RGTALAQHSAAGDVDLEAIEQRAGCRAEGERTGGKVYAGDVYGWIAQVRIRMTDAGVASLELHGSGEIDAFAVDPFCDTNLGGAVSGGGQGWDAGCKCVGPIHTRVGAVCVAVDVVDWLGLGTGDGCESADHEQWERESEHDDLRMPRRGGAHRTEREL